MWIFSGRNILLTADVLFFFPKPSQEKTHKYSSKQITYFPADMHFAFPYFHSIFPTHTVHIVTGKTVYMRTLAWQSPNSPWKSWVKNYVGLFSLAIGVFLFNVKLLGKDSTKPKFSLKAGVWHQLTLVFVCFLFFKRQIQIISWRLFHAEKPLNSVSFWDPRLPATKLPSFRIQRGW